MDPRKAAAMMKKVFERKWSSDEDDNELPGTSSTSTASTNVTTNSNVRQIKKMTIKNQHEKIDDDGKNSNSSRMKNKVNSRASSITSSTSKRKLEEDDQMMEVDSKKSKTEEAAKEVGNKKISLEWFKTLASNEEEMKNWPIASIHEYPNALAWYINPNEEWKIPVKVLDFVGLQVQMPILDKIVMLDHYFDRKMMIDAIDVECQKVIEISLGHFIDIWNQKERKQTLNVLSLEFSNMKLAKHVVSPIQVRILSWFDHYIWKKKNIPGLEPPSVRHYLLLSMKNSYTDYHIDFAGSSVWYRMLKGSKIFFVIEPTPENLEAFKQNEENTLASADFFHNNAKAIHLEANETLFIPSGWIHAVFTPVDAIAIGGNFLHSLSIPMQIKIYEMEKSMGTGIKYKLKNFELWNVYGAELILEKLKADENVSNLYIEAAEELCKFYKNPKIRMHKKLAHEPLMMELERCLKERKCQLHFNQGVIPTVWKNKPRLIIGEGDFLPQKEQIYAIDKENKLYLVRKCPDDCGICQKLAKIKEVSKEEEEAINCYCVNIETMTPILETHFAINKNVKWYEFK